MRLMEQDIKRDYSFSLEIAITENNFLQWVQFGNNLHMEWEGQI